MEGGFALEKRFDGDDRSCRPKRRVRDVVSRSEITLGNELSGDVVDERPETTRIGVDGNLAPDRFSRSRVAHG